jgi:osmoprotectant transport system permease protein
VRALVAGIFVAWSIAASAAEPIRIGSKNFPESALLAEIAAQLLEANGFQVERMFGLGGTLICYEALTNGEIDLYPEYTGTLTQSILNIADDRDVLDARLRERGLRLLDNIGFNNSYGITVRASDAERLGLQTIGDLSRQPELNIVVSHEFIDREDGWRGLKERYGLPQEVTGIEHSLAYRALRDGAIDVTEAYTTDAEIDAFDFIVLDDDRDYFPKYFAAPLVRDDVNPRVIELLGQLAGTITDAQMQALNAEIVFAKRSEGDVAGEFLQSRGIEVDVVARSWVQDLVSNTFRHLQLTGIALAAAIAVGLGLSLIIYTNQTVSGVVIYVCGLMQTIPSIALLALMIPLFGIGMTPAIVALFMYSLLPIVRNAVTALVNVDPVLVRVATALGLSARERLRHVLIPLALPSIFAGIRTAAVISIGTATLAAFIGAGGLGDPIVSGLSRVDVNLILQGAIPAAVLAILTELAFGAIEKRVIARG